MKIKSDKIFTRSCPQCNKIIYYKDEWYKNFATKEKRLCKECYYNRQSKYKDQKFLRNCPNCNKLIKYKSVYRYNIANKENCWCKSCNTNGENNPFYGRSHNNETKQILSNYKKGISISEEHKNKIKEYAKTHNNPMKGRSFYSVWVKQYGKRIADGKLVEYKKNKSIQTSGINNPMYGKPSPQGTGQGWKGWYKNHYFRSLRELSYMIYLEENNMKWESGESNKYAVKYIDYNGVPKTYRPDFIINNNKVIEIKPKKLHNSPTVLRKKEAMETFCNENKLSYEIIDFDINIDKIYQGYKDKSIIFMKDYADKFLNYIQ